MNAAWMLTAALLAGAFGGRWLDGKAGSSPLFLMLGLGLGLAVGMYEIARVALRSRRKGR